MSVHRINDAAEAALQRVARLEGRKPSEVLSELIIEYERGLSFRVVGGGGPGQVYNPDGTPMKEGKDA